MRARRKQRRDDDKILERVGRDQMHYARGCQDKNRFSSRQKAKGWLEARLREAKLAQDRARFNSLVGMAPYKCKALGGHWHLGHP